MDKALEKKLVHPKTLEKQQKQNTVAHLLSIGHSQGEVSKITHVPESTIRAWFRSDAQFHDIVLMQAKRAGRRFLPQAMSVIKEFLGSEKDSSKKWAVEQVLELNGFKKKGTIIPQINAPAKVIVNMGLEDDGKSVEVTEEDVNKANEIVAAEWDITNEGT